MNSQLEAGRTHLKAGQTQEAIRLLSGVVREDPSDFDARFLLGIAYGQSGDFPLAIDVLNSALLINPNHAVCQFNVGMAYQKAGNQEAAIQAYARALRLDPSYAAPREALKSLRPDADLDSLIHPPSAPSDYSSESRSYSPSEPNTVAAHQSGLLPSERSLEWGADAIANPVSRFVAFVIDNALLGAVSVFAAVVGFGDFFGIPYAPELIYETVTIGMWGQSAGKSLMNIQVDKINGDDITWPEAFLRASIKYGLPMLISTAAWYLLPKNLRMVGNLFPLIMYGWVFTNGNRQALHDVLAKTIVTRA